MKNIYHNIKSTYKTGPNPQKTKRRSALGIAFVGSERPHGWREVFLLALATVSLLLVGVRWRRQ